MKKGLLLISGLVAAGAAQASLIDGFTDGASAISTTSVSTTATSQVAASVFGGQRNLGQTFVSGGANRTAAAVANGSFAVSNPFTVVTDTQLAYGNVGAPIGGAFFLDLAAANLSLDANALKLNFMGNEQNLVVDVVLFSGVSNNSMFDPRRYTKIVAGNQLAPFSVSITDADLVLAGSTTFASFDTLGVFFRPAASGDFELASIEAVPEPATLAGLGIALAAMARRRKKA